MGESSLNRFFTRKGTDHEYHGTDPDREGIAAIANHHTGRIYRWRARQALFRESAVSSQAQDRTPKEAHGSVRGRER